MIQSQLQGQSRQQTVHRSQHPVYQSNDQEK